MPIDKENLTGSITGGSDHPKETDTFKNNFGDIFDRIDLKNRLNDGEKYFLLYQSGGMKIHLSSLFEYVLIKTEELPELLQQHVQGDYVFIDEKLFYSSLGKKGYIDIFENKTHIIGRSNNKMFPSQVSGTHMSILCKDNQVTLMDVGSLNGSFIEKKYLQSQRVSPREVPRISDVHCIGDLHGNYQAFLKNLSDLGLVDDNKNWAGGSAKLVFLGDIFADRYNHSIKIIHHIHKLKQQARKEGGDIFLLGGNHDDIFISFLLNKPCAGSKNATYKDFLPEQIAGIYEYKKFDTSDGFDAKTVLNNMSASIDGNVVLQEISQIFVCKKVDDVLYTHTDLTDEMGQMILEKGIDELNRIFQTTLKLALLDRMSFQFPKEFLDIVDVFLNTDNRHYLTPITAQRLKHQGINLVMHGHSNKGGNRQHVGELLIHSIDSHFGMNDDWTTPSNATVLKTGEVKSHGGKFIFPMSNE